MPSSQYSFFYLLSATVEAETKSKAEKKLHLTDCFTGNLPHCRPCVFGDTDPDYIAPSTQWGMRPHSTQLSKNNVQRCSSHQCMEITMQISVVLLCHCQVGKLKFTVHVHLVQILSLSQWSLFHPELNLRSGERITESIILFCIRSNLSPKPILPWLLLLWNSFNMGTAFSKIEQLQNPD